MNKPQTQLMDRFMHSKHSKHNKSIIQIDSGRTESTIETLRINMSLVEYTHKISSSLFKSRNILFLAGTLPTLYSIFSQVAFQELEFSHCTGIDKRTLNLLSLDQRFCLACSNDAQPTLKLTDYFGQISGDLLVSRYIRLAAIMILSVIVYISGLFLMSTLLTKQKYRLRMLAAGVSTPQELQYVKYWFLYVVFLGCRFAYFDQFTDITSFYFVKQPCESGYLIENAFMYYQIKEFSSLFEKIKLIIQSTIVMATYLIMVHGCSSYTRFINDDEFKNLLTRRVFIKFHSILPIGDIRKRYKALSKEQYCNDGKKLLKVVQELQDERLLMQYKDYVGSELERQEKYYTTSPSIYLTAMMQLFKIMLFLFFIVAVVLDSVLVWWMYIIFFLGLIFILRDVATIYKLVLNDLGDKRPLHKQFLKTGQSLIVYSFVWFLGEIFILDKFDPSQLFLVLFTIFQLLAMKYKVFCQQYTFIQIQELIQDEMTSVRKGLSKQFEFILKSDEEE